MSSGTRNCRSKGKQVQEPLEKKRGHGVSHDPGLSAERLKKTICQRRRLQLLQQRLRRPSCGGLRDVAWSAFRVLHR
jgi:hypothetical protein